MEDRTRFQRHSWQLAVLVVVLLLAGTLTDRTPVAAQGATITAESTSTGRAAKVTGQGTAQPPAPSAAFEQQVQTAMRTQPRQDAITPVDATAPLRHSPPTVAASGVNNTTDAQPAISPNDFVFTKQSDLGSGRGSLINEPSNASRASTVLTTWNWYAAISRNTGTTWSYYNPATLFPASYGGFCCDQVAYYDQGHDLTFWILQYSNDRANNNAIRLAWSKGSALDTAQFCYTDFTPQQVGSPTGTNYDQPKFARSDNDLYMEMTRYGAASGSVVIRIAASQFTWPGCSGVNYQYFSPGLFSPGFTQRAYATMYLAAHVSTSQLRIFAWPESSSSIAIHDVSHTTYPQNLPYRCPRTGGSATSDWCQRRSFGGGWAHTDRIFTGWLNGSVTTFMWDASQGTGGFGTFNYPYVHAARIDTSSYTLVGEPIMWNGSFAFSYASAALNDRLAVAGTVMYGGGTTYENCAAFIWDDITPPPPPWAVYTAQTSNSDPNDTLSGDYLSTRRNAPKPNTWGGSCYALIGGGANANVHTYYDTFGRRRDQ